MTTLTFLGSHVSYQPTRIPTRIDRSQTTKYRGQVLEIREPVARKVSTKGLIYRGVAY